jgi:hypothetical protein
MAHGSPFSTREGLASQEHVAYMHDLAALNKHVRTEMTYDDLLCEFGYAVHAYGLIHQSSPLLWGPPQDAGPLSTLKQRCMSKQNCATTFTRIHWSKMCHSHGNVPEHSGAHEITLA